MKIFSTLPAFIKKSGGENSHQKHDFPMKFIIDRRMVSSGLLERSSPDVPESRVSDLIERNGLARTFTVVDDGLFTIDPLDDGPRRSGLHHITPGTLSQKFQHFKIGNLNNFIFFEIVFLSQIFDLHGGVIDAYHLNCFSVV